MSMKCLVTGGAGFIGSNLARYLVQKGHEVTVLDNLSTGYIQNVQSQPQVRFVRGDVREAALIKELCAGKDAVFHLAASVGNARSIRDPILDSDVNIMGTLNLLTAARASGVRRFVFSSSAGIFGELKHLPIKEDHPVEPDTPYGASKLGAEKLCLAFGKLYGIQAVALRYFNVYGAYQRYDAYGNVIPIFIHRLLQNQPLTIFGDGEQTRDFVNVRDVVAANYKAATAPGASGSFNIASGRSVTIKALAERMIAIAGGRCKIEYEPPRPGDVRHSLADISSANSVLGYKPGVELEEGLAEHFAWSQKDSTQGAEAVL